MSEMLFTMLEWIYNNAIVVIDLITSVGSFITQLTGYNKYLNPFNDSIITLLLTTIVGIYVAVKMKRLIT